MYLWTKNQKYMYLWTKNRLDMRLKLKAYGKFGGFVHFPDVKSAET